MFTVGQRAVMRASLTLSCLGSLTTPANLVATGTNDSYQPPANCPAPPLAGIYVDRRQMCAKTVNIGECVFFGYGTTNALNAAGAQLRWSFPGGVPAKEYGAGPQAIGLPGRSGPALATGVYVVRLTLGEQSFATRVLVPWRTVEPNNPSSTSG